MNNSENIVVHAHDASIDEEYIQWISDIKQRFKSTQIKAAVKVNSEQLLFNWQLGRDLVERKAEERWGKGIVEQLSLDLQASFPGIKGFSARNLWFMKQWYTFYASDYDTVKYAGNFKTSNFLGDKKLNQLGSEIEEYELNQTASEYKFPSFFAFVPWRHHVLIVQRCKSIEEALFYIERTIKDNLSRNALENYIRADLYHNADTAVTNFSEQLPSPHGQLAQELLKGNYNLGFISLSQEYNEESLEDAIEKQMTRFLLELGEGWAFVGRQKEIIISGKTRKIDLLFYHIYLRSYVVIELKVTSFEPEFAGKLNFYVNAVDMLVRRDSDNQTIGLLICKDIDQTEVQLAFQGVTTPMGVATYDNIRIKEIQEYLPSVEQIQQQIEIAEKEFLSSKREGNYA